MIGQIVVSVVSGLLISVVSVVGGALYQQLRQARAAAARSELIGEGVRELLLCRLESLRHEMVVAGGIADDDLKARAQRLYDIYHQMGGNGHGTQLNLDIQRAPIAAKPKPGPGVGGNNDPEGES